MRGKDPALKQRYIDAAKAIRDAGKEVDLLELAMKIHATVDGVRSYLMRRTDVADIILPGVDISRMPKFRKLNPPQHG